MAFTRKLTAIRGKPYSGDVVFAAGADEATHDRISVNIDADKMSKGEALILLESIRAAIFEADWPMA